MIEGANPYQRTTGGEVYALPGRPGWLDWNRVVKPSAFDYRGEVAAIQEFLGAQGDGLIGPETRTAVARAHAILRSTIGSPAKGGEAVVCTPDHAVDVAYLISTAEAELMKDNGDRMEIGDVLTQYCTGRLSSEEARRALTGAPQS